MGLNYDNIKEDTKRLMESLGIDLYDEEGKVDVKSYKIAHRLNNFRRRDSGQYIGKAEPIVPKSYDAGKRFAFKSMYTGDIIGSEIISGPKEMIKTTLEDKIISHKDVEKFGKDPLDGFRTVDSDIPKGAIATQMSTNIGSFGEHTLKVQYQVGDTEIIYRKYIVKMRME